MTLDRVDWHLENWAQWMRGGAYRHLAVRLVSAETGRSWGSQDFDNMVEAADTIAAKATNAVVQDLPGIFHSAIHCWYLGHRWNVHTMMLTPVVERAKQSVALGLTVKGFV